MSGWVLFQNHIYITNYLSYGCECLKYDFVNNNFTILLDFPAKRGNIILVHDNSLLIIGQSVIEFDSNLTEISSIREAPKLCHGYNQIAYANSNFYSLRQTKTLAAFNTISRQIEFHDV
jgi:hypothetical protein